MRRQNGIEIASGGAAVGIGCFVLIIWVAGVLLSLALTATIIWAIIHLVLGL